MTYQLSNKKYNFEQNRKTKKNTCGRHLLVYLGYIADPKIWELRLGCC